MVHFPFNGKKGLEERGNSMFNLTEFFQSLGANALTAEIISSIVLFALVAFVGWIIWFIFDRYFSKLAAKYDGNSATRR